MTTTRQLKDLTAELAYAAIKHSELFEQLDNADCDTEADNLTVAITRVINSYLAHRLADNAECERLDALTEFMTAATAPSLKSLREVESERRESEQEIPYE